MWSTDQVPDIAATRGLHVLGDAGCETCREGVMTMSVAIAQLESRGYQVFLCSTDRVSLSRQVRGRFVTVHVYRDGSVEYDVWDSPHY